MPFDISEHLERQFFHGKKHGFYIWPGYFFVRMDFVKNIPLDFRPSLRLRGDTGACNCYHLFKNIDWTKYELATEKHCYFEGSTDLLDGGYSLFNHSWVHCWNASNYAGKTNIKHKMQLIYEMLEEKLTAN